MTYDEVRFQRDKLLDRLLATNGLLILLMRTLGGVEQREVTTHYNLNRAAILAAAEDER